MRTSRRLVLPAIAALAIGAAAIFFLRRDTTAPPVPQRPIVASLRAEPRSFNRLTTTDRSSAVLGLLLHARLVQLNHRTQEIEPALATKWTADADGRTYTLDLRQDVAFSDGAPFTADDVLFTFEALYDPRTDSPLASGLTVNGQPIAVRKTGSHTVVLTLPAPFGPGLRILNPLPILPAHKLRDAFSKGTFAKAWGITTSPSELAGLGPYVLRAYSPGERLELASNPRYGARGPDVKPQIERLTLRIIPSMDAERLVFESGEIDLLNAEVRPDDLTAIRALEAAGKARTFDLGPAVDADAFWFNLGPDGRKPAIARPWLNVDVRRAVSHAVDRAAFVNMVYLGAGVPIDGPVTPGNRAWHTKDLPAYPHDVAKARTLLAGAGLKDVNGDGIFETAQGRLLTIELLTQKGHALRERGAAVIESDMEDAGLTVNVVALDIPALVDRLTKGSYDAVYFATSSSDTDPSANLDYWLSSGSFHVWHPRQKTPATPWEAEIDRLMHELTGLTDARERHARFTRVQQIFATELPVLFFAAPSLVTATSQRVDGFEPAVIYPYLLWRADTMRPAQAASAAASR